MPRKEQYRARVRDGLCGTCGGPRDAETKQCRACLDGYRERAKASRQARRESGLCRCGRPPLEGTSQCDGCREKGRKDLRARYRRLSAAGLCVCGKFPRPGKRTCADCGTMQSRFACEQTRRWASAGLCRRCGEQPVEGRTCCEPCLKYQAEFNRSWRTKLKAEVIAGYGGKCVCCGETTYEFLTFDHVNNDGAAHRKEIGNGTEKIMRWIIANDYPDSIAVRCWNCNCAREYFGVCPHEAARLRQNQPSEET